MSKETVRAKAQGLLKDAVAARLLEQLHFRYVGALRKGRTDTPQSYADLMRDTKFSYKQVRRGLDVLRDKRLICRRRGLFGSKNVGHYSLPIEVMKWLEGTSECAPAGTYEHDLEGTSECAPEGSFLHTGTSSETSSGTSSMNEHSLVAASPMPGVVSGEEGEMKNVKSVKDVEAAVKAQSILHKPNSTTALEFIWKKRVAEITKAPVVWLKEDFHKLGKFAKLCPAGQAETVLNAVLDDWIAFVKKAETMGGAKNTPSVPRVGFLLSYTGIAVILAQPKPLPPMKQEAPVAVKSGPSMPLTSPAPKPVVEKPKSLAEIWADDDEDEE